MNESKVTTIDLEEGLDVCIYRIMLDRQWRSANEIADIFSKQVNIHRGAVKDKVIQMFVSKRYFERRDLGNSRVTYRLKKTASSPRSLKSPLIPEANIVEPVSSPFKDVVNQAMFATSAILNSPPAPVPEIKSAPREVVSLGDGLELAIWKIMSDYEPYRTGEIAMLLADVGFASNTVTARISSLHFMGWFEREQASNREYIYKLLPTTPRPEPSVYTQRFRRTREEIQESKKPASKAPLLELTIRIKGMPFTFIQAKQLLEELQMAGYGKGESSPAFRGSFLNVSMTIREVSFTAAELEDLVNRLTLSGIGRL